MLEHAEATCSRIETQLQEWSGELQIESLQVAADKAETDAKHLIEDRGAIQSAIARFK